MSDDRQFSDVEREAVYRAIFERRDVRRNFLPTPIPDQVLTRVLTAAHHAGSVGFMQPWDFVVIRNRSTKRAVKGLFQKANAEAFTNGWFRTGDQGVLDAEGYLSITGRLKEIINRGGEKISPREVDEILLDHPAVAQAITFAMPHAKLGEEVAAARAGETLDFRIREPIGRFDFD